VIKKLPVLPSRCATSRQLAEEVKGFMPLAPSVTYTLPKLLNRAIYF